MKTIATYLVLLLIAFTTKNLSAQEDDDRYQKKIEILQSLRDDIIQEEKEKLKEEVEQINEQLKNENITSERARVLKEEAAKKYALNIDNKVAIVDNKIALLRRNEDDVIKLESDSLNKDMFKKNHRLFGINIKKTKEPKYQKRTHTDLVLAFGLNNANRNNESFSESPYKFFGSRFFEVGYAWNTRLGKNSNWLRLKYGFSFQFNSLKPTNNRYFTQVEDDNGFARVVLSTVPGLNGGPDFRLSKSKLRMDNFVFPFHFEFGPSTKRKNGPYVRYSTYKKWKFGIGGFAGFNYNNIQKVKLDKNSSLATFLGSGGNQKTIYGLSSYFGIGDISFYFKYDLTQIFPGPSKKQNNVSAGVRFDLD